MKKLSWFLLFMVLISAEVHAEYSLLLSTEKGEACFFEGGLKCSLDEGIAKLKVRIAQGPCEIKVFRSLPVGVVVDVRERLMKRGIKSPAWVVIDEKGVQPHKILSVDLIAEKSSEVEEIQIEEIVGEGNNVNRKTNINVESEWVVTGKQLIEERIRKILPDGYKTDGVTYISPSSYTEEHNEYGYYMFSIKKKGVEYFPGTMKKWPIFIVFHPSYNLLPDEKNSVFFPGQTILRTPSMFLYVFGQFHKNWPSMTNDLAKAFSGDLGLKWQRNDTEK